MKKVLIFSTTFFPDPAVGAVRMTQWCRHLPANGWTPVVACRYYGYAATPEELAAAVHPSVRVHYLRTPQMPDDSRSGRIRRWAALRATLGGWPLTRFLVHLFVPDIGVLFWRAARREAEELVERERPDVILTTSPSHSTHDIGRWLSRRTGIPWVADFRDPFLSDERVITRSAMRIVGAQHRRFEAEVYRNAALVLHAVPMHGRRALDQYASARDRIVTLPNGCPPELADGLVTPALTVGDRKSVRIVGKCGPLEARDLSESVSNLAGRGHDLELRIVGPPPPNAEFLRGRLGDRLVIPGALPHELALREISGADVLVCTLSAAASQEMGLSSKLFEYLAVPRPVIVVNPTLSDRQLAEGLVGIQLLTAPSRLDVELAIERALDEPAAGMASRAAEFGRRFRRDSQAAELARLMDRIALPASDGAAPPVDARVRG